MAETGLTQPLVSICIPAYNVEGYINDTIQSAIDQTYKNIEIIVVDDGSTDNTPSITDGFSGENIRVCHQKNAGAAAARNLAYKDSKGEYIKFLDGDDLINPEMVESQVKLATLKKDSIISSKWGRFYNNDIQTFKLSPEDCWQTLSPVEWLCSSWKDGSSMTQSGIFLLPRTVIENAGLWDEKLSLIDDLDFFTRAILKSNSVVFDPDSILYYRSGNQGTLSDQKAAKAVQSAFMAIDQATGNLLSADNNAAAKLACANIWQHFIYDTYPQYPELVTVAERKVNEFGGSSLKFKCGGITKILVNILGWKTTKSIKRLLQ